MIFNYIKVKYNLIFYCINSKCDSFGMVSIVCTSKAQKLVTLSWNPTFTKVYWQKVLKYFIFWLWHYGHLRTDILNSRTKIKGLGFKFSRDYTALKLEYKARFTGMKIEEKSRQNVSKYCRACPKESSMHGT